MDKVEIYTNKEAELVEFIHKDWRFALWMADDPLYTFVEKLSINGSMYWEKLPDDALDILRGED